MIPHNCCVEHGCRMGFVQNLPGLALPKFAIGQAVRIPFEPGDGEILVYQGVVVGLFPAPHLWKPGWWYVVRCHDVPGQDYLTLPIDDECHESEMELIEPESLSSTLQR